MNTAVQQQVAKVASFASGVRQQLAQRGGYATLFQSRADPLKMRQFIDQNDPVGGDTRKLGSDEFIKTAFRPLLALGKGLMKPLGSNIANAGRTSKVMNTIGRPLGVGMYGAGAYHAPSAINYAQSRIRGTDQAHNYNQGHNAYYGEQDRLQSQIGKYQSGEIDSLGSGSWWDRNTPDMSRFLYGTNPLLGGADSPERKQQAEAWRKQLATGGGIGNLDEYKQQAIDAATAYKQNPSNRGGYLTKWQTTPDVNAMNAFMKKYGPGATPQAPGAVPTPPLGQMPWLSNRGAGPIDWGTMPGTGYQGGANYGHAFSANPANFYYDPDPVSGK